MNWLGLDIGGANLKAADGAGWARSLPYPLWREPAGLSSALVALFESAPAVAGLAVTMTGELCDCFSAKAEGVCHILDAVEQAADGREIRVYLLDGRLATLDEARTAPQLAAASNWHALATFVCRFNAADMGLLLDVGSTTTDIVPLVAGRPQPDGLNDTDRLLAGELVYMGVGRTPVCALMRALPWRGVQCPIASELFATTADAYVVLGQLAEQPAATWTADGRPLTREFSRARLGRMICADSTEFTMDDARRAARAIRDAQRRAWHAAIRRVAAGMSRPPDWLLVSGAGEVLASEIVPETLSAARVELLSARLGPAASGAAPAHAVAVLARESALVRFHN